MVCPMGPLRFLTRTTPAAGQHTPEVAEQPESWMPLDLRVVYRSDAATRTGVRSTSAVEPAESAPDRARVGRWADAGVVEHPEAFA